jgi:hypothetical protein
MTRMPLPAMSVSASFDVGPLAPSAMILTRGRMAPTFSSVS